MLFYASVHLQISLEKQTVSLMFAMDELQSYFFVFLYSSLGA